MASCSEKLGSSSHSPRKAFSYAWKRKDINPWLPLSLQVLSRCFLSPQITLTIHTERISPRCVFSTEIVKPVRFRTKFCSKTASADFQLTAQEYIWASILCFAAFARWVWFRGRVKLLSLTSFHYLHKCVGYIIMLVYFQFTAYLPESWYNFELWLGMFWWDRFNSNIKEISANLVRAWVSGCIPTLTASSTSPPRRLVEVPAEIWKFCRGIQLGGKWSTFFAHSSASWGNVIQTWDLCNQQLGNNVTNRQYHASVFQ